MVHSVFSTYFPLRSPCSTWHKWTPLGVLFNVAVRMLQPVNMGMEKKYAFQMGYVWNGRN